MKIASICLHLYFREAASHNTPLDEMERMAKSLNQYNTMGFSVGWVQIYCGYGCEI